MKKKSHAILIASLMLILTVAIVCFKLRGGADIKGEKPHAQTEILLRNDGAKDQNSTIRVDNINQENSDPDQGLFRAFHKNWNEVSIESLKDFINSSENKYELAIRLIGAENEIKNYGRSVKVGMAMVDWPESYAKAISKTLKGEHYSKSVSIFTSSLIERAEVAALGVLQSSLKMGVDRANVGRDLVKMELAKTGSLDRVFEHVGNMETSLDQGYALDAICVRMHQLENLATKENVDAVLALASSAGVSERTRSLLLGSTTTRHLLEPKTKQ